ncbi:MAG: hemerythrin domain-containing protein [Terriglobales bacterium]
MRDPSLAPLSRQHQHALALCVRIRRALQAGASGPQAPGADAWNAEVRDTFAEEIGAHFAAEEALVFPEARRFPALAPLVEGLLRDHASLRELFQQADAGKLDATGLSDFARQLDDHIRKEERQLFEQMQELVPPERLEKLGQALETFLAEHGAGPSCKINP